MVFDYLNKMDSYCTFLQVEIEWIRILLCI